MSYSDGYLKDHLNCKRSVESLFKEADKRIVELEESNTIGCKNFHKLRESKQQANLALEEIWIKYSNLIMDSNGRDLLDEIDKIL